MNVIMGWQPYVNHIYIYSKTFIQDGGKNSTLLTKHPGLSIVLDCHNSLWLFMECIAIKHITIVLKNNTLMP